MKKIILAVSMFLTIGVSATFANDGTKVDPKVLSAFQNDFASAKDAKWEIKTGISQVKFSLYDQYLIAWYNEEAKLISTVRNILYQQLPLSVIKSLEDKYNGADFLSITEVTKENETNYFIQVETKEKKLLLKANSSGNLSVVKKIKD